MIKTLKEYRDYNMLVESIKPVLDQGKSKSGIVRYSIMLVKPDIVSGE
jgi:hypothetical protein